MGHKCINKANKYCIKDEVATVVVTRQNGEVYEVLVDTEDLPKLKGWSICINVGSQIRAQVSKGDNTLTMLHRLIMNAPTGKVVDHINHDPLDNRKSNLRIVTHAENMQNLKGATSRSSTGVRGVFWREDRGNWQVRIKVGGKNITVGTFNNLEGAEKAAKQFRAEHMPYSQEALNENSSN